MQHLTMVYRNMESCYDQYCTVAGTTTYTFTPTDACATTATIDIVITTPVTPTFTPIGPLCQNSTAPALPDL